MDGPLPVYDSGPFLGMVCKPNSVPDSRRRSFIWDRRYRRPRATYPEPRFDSPRLIPFYGASPDEQGSLLGRPLVITKGRPIRRTGAGPTHWFPIRSCTRWGFPCRRCHHRRGALLPHLFTLAIPIAIGIRRYLFCGTFPRPPERTGGYCPPPRPVVFGLSSRHVAERSPDHSSINYNRPPAGVKHCPVTVATD